MRDILSKVMAGSMIAGAALLVAACGGGNESTANNTTANGLESEPMYDGGMGNGLDAGMGNASDMNMTTDLNQAENAVSNAAEAIDNAQANAH